MRGLVSQYFVGRGESATWWEGWVVTKKKDKEKMTKIKKSGKVQKRYKQYYFIVFFGKL